jgi:molybdopterin converting factor small subunit
MPDPITVRVHLYGILRDKLPSDSGGVTHIQLPAKSSIQDVTTCLGLSGHLQIALNDEVVDDSERVLSDRDTLDIFLSVAGG